MTTFRFHGSDGFAVCAAVVGYIYRLAAAGECQTLALLHGGVPNHHSQVASAHQLAYGCV